MQLLVILIMLLCGGNNNTFNEIKPLLQDVGGEDAAKAISQAEELNSVISAVQNLNGSENSDIASILNSFAGGIFGGDSNVPQQTDGYGNTNYQSSDGYGNTNSQPSGEYGNTNFQTQQADGYNDTKSYKANNSCENCSQSNNFPLSPIIPLAPDEILLPLCKYLCN
jgi:hypothetical protein